MFLEYYGDKWHFSASNARKTALEKTQQQGLFPQIMTRLIFKNAQICLCEQFYVFFFSVYIHQLKEAGSEQTSQLS